MLHEFVDLSGLQEDVRAYFVSILDRKAALEDKISNLEHENAGLKFENDILQQETQNQNILIEKLKLQLAVLRRARFGRSAGKIDRQIEQLELMIGELEESQAQEVPLASLEPTEHQADTRNLSTRKYGRRPLPDHLPREVIEHLPDCICPACGSSRHALIQVESRELLEYVPGHFKVIVHNRPKVSCRECETIRQRPLPEMPFFRGRPGPALLAHTLVSKYCDHQPLYRQSEIHSRSGVDISRSTLADWVGSAARLLEPLYDAIGRYVLTGEAIHADDTPVPVLDPGRGKTRTARLWAAVRDERPWGSRAPPAVFYHYSPDRKAEHAVALLGKCSGYLHADGYAGFKRLYAPNEHGVQDLVEVGCMAHARRKIYDVHQATKSPAAKAILDLIDSLFALERHIHGGTPEDRKTARQTHAVPILTKLHSLLQDTIRQTSKKSGLGQAIQYALVRWDALSRYTEDGKLELSNNAAERAIRPLALGRKNWLFAGSDKGGKRAAIVYTLVQSARLNGLDPERYLTMVLNRVGEHPINRIEELLPWQQSNR